MATKKKALIKTTDAEIREALKAARVRERTATKIKATHYDRGGDAVVCVLSTGATLTVPRKVSWSGADTIAEEDRLAFSVWHGLEAHRPLGSINRARQAAYDMSAKFRGKFNGCQITEPTD